MKQVVIVLNEGVYGIVKQYGAHASMVTYCVDGIEYTVYIPNEEFEEVSDL